MKIFKMSAVSMAIAFVFSAGVMAEVVTKDAYKAGEARIAAEYAADKTKCDGLASAESDRCVQAAKVKFGM